MRALDLRDEGDSLILAAMLDQALQEAGYHAYPILLRENGEMLCCHEHDDFTAYSDDGTYGHRTFFVKVKFDAWNGKFLVESKVIA